MACFRLAPGRPSTRLPAARRPDRSALSACLLAALWLGGTAALFTGCGEAAKQTYDIDIIATPDVFVGGEEVVLLAGDVMAASTKIMNGAPFSLNYPDVEPGKTTYFEIRVKGAGGALIAQGRSPELEVLNASTKIRILVQRPGTLSAGAPLDRKLQGHYAVATETLRTADLSLDMPVAMFGSGLERTGAGQSPEALSNEVYVYNPVVHRPERMQPMAGSARTHAATVNRGDDLVCVFGGDVRDPAAPGQWKPVPRLDVLRMGRRPLASFEVAQQVGFDGPAESARSRAAMVQSGRPLYAFGGLGTSGAPLDDVVEIDLDARPMMPVVMLTHTPMGGMAAPVRMSSARVGHTATAVTLSAAPMGMARPQVLVFGGGEPGKPVADLFDATTKLFVPLDVAAAGPMRHHHGAVTVSLAGQARVLILGGRNGPDAAAAALGDSLLYDPATQTFMPAPITLRTPRSHFTVFTIDRDLVVLGGLGPTGQPVATAEVYDLETLAFVNETPAAARASATAVPLPTATMLVLGGTTADSTSDAVEFYKPRAAVAK